MNNSVLGIIPARFGSTRFMGKPLAEIKGQSLIYRTYENALRASCLDKLVVATDDERIFEHARSFRADVVMTSINCQNGTERLIEVVSQYPSYRDYDIIVNIQGDEPFLPISSIESVVQDLKDNPLDVMSTAICRLHSEEEWKNPAVVKCVRALTGHALYFSRSMLPGSKNIDFNSEGPFFKHLGLYAYRKPFLLHYGKLPDTILQKKEDLEQLKVLEHGYAIRTVECKDSGISVDHQEDIFKIEEWLCTKSSFS